VDAAFSDFQDALAKLYKLLEDAGVLNDGRLAAYPGQPVIPRAMLADLLVHK